MQHPSARAVGMQVTNDPPCRARGLTQGSEHVVEENRLYSGGTPWPACASDCVRLFDSYGLLNR